MTSRPVPRRIPPHILAALLTPLLTALAVLAAVPWWSWEDGLLPLRAFLAVLYGAGAGTALVLPALLKARAPEGPPQEVTR